MKKIFSILAFLFLIITNSANAIENNSKSTQQAIFIPSGVNLEVLLATEINSKSATVGQKINAIILEDFSYKSKVIAPKESVVEGTVVYNRKTKTKKTIELKIRFTSIRTPYNNQIPISAIIKTDDNTGVLRKKNKVIVPTNTMITIHFVQPITLSAQ